MPRVEVIYFSGFGHTAKQAEAILGGASEVSDARLWAIPEDGLVSEALWEAADSADAIIFGGPTYMGGVPWQFKRFADDSSKRWFSGAWANKFAGGFTNSASFVGDKGETMGYLQTLAAQHGMIWVSLGQPPANALEHGPTDMNRLGGSAGALAVSPSDASSEQAPEAGDLQSAHAYGRRVAAIAEAKIIV
ncbi:flavodoxin family protein [Cognatishimia sp. WU-CL00825]|uniref:flavodoxin family protein n=1 Tax=Cognatishimia sp. WU-CL00825 TaxID=3127658 RepID=UPI00310327D6